MDVSIAETFILTAVIAAVTSIGVAQLSVNVLMRGFSATRKT